MWRTYDRSFVDIEVKVGSNQDLIPSILHVDTVGVHTEYYKSAGCNAC